MTFKITNIDWDTDGNNEDFDSLPQEVMVTVDDYHNIADALSDAYGWGVNTFDVDDTLYEWVDSPRGYMYQPIT